ncbi:MULTISPECIES: SSI family serine proteinase inhibitor [Streptomyces]|uniref:Serine protease n=2 Tax=Streptomyces TaxID=1883 RepID=A0A2U9P8S2_STRAS|nr:SSI family serine proteinase inhibitor [Streptomyces actuosus]AWT46096.1 serine protease [Streptomyces actuosus]MBM4822759.1 serine protease [Streptomyces actuosus]
MTYLARSIAGGLLSAALLTVAAQPAAAALAVPGGLPATAAVPGPVERPATADLPTPVAPLDDWLYLTVTRGDASAGDARGALLLCAPPQGHARAAQACAELAAADGDIAALPLKDVYCPMVYAPVTVRAQGEWGGRPVTYTETFPNGCVMAARTGAVFALDG